MEEKKELLDQYSIGVLHPEVSGFEILELLDLRTQVAQLESELTKKEEEKLEESDSTFLKNANRFYENLSQVGNLSKMRKQRGVLPSHWWWYLEKLVQVEKIPSGGRL